MTGASRGIEGAPDRRTHRCTVRHAIDHEARDRLVRIAHDELFVGLCGGDIDAGRGEGSVIFAQCAGVVMATTPSPSARPCWMKRGTVEATF